MSIARIFFAAWLLFPCTLAGQVLPVTFSIDPTKDTLSISPFIYGTNGQSDDWEANITARRLGGNRMTGYNWENNASNMGMDYNQSNANDDYMTWSAGIPQAQANIPGITLTAFHDTSLAMSCYSLITLPAAGYVSRDKDGPVLVADSAPSPRWRRVVNVKGSALSLTPDTSDGFVYLNEEVNFLVQRYGSAATPNGVRGYAVDNEPALWPSTHPRLHPRQTTGWEVIAKNVAVARAVKSVDPAAEVFGGVFYGFNELYNMQDAPDKKDFEGFGRYVNGYLKYLHDSSTAAGKRLIDVLDLHWYPDLNVPIVGNDNVDSVTVQTRIQAPRSLWDSTYKENGWIGQWFSPVSLLPNTLTGIAQYNPGTKLAITEFDYGAPHHISGAIAQCDVLGIFGKYGVYFSSHWGAVTDYLQSAYKMYRNYDGKRSTYGDLSVHATTPDVSNSAVYASLHKALPGVMDIIAINKSFHRPITATFHVAGPTQYQSARVFFIDSATSAIQEGTSLNIQGNSFASTLAPLSVTHFVLSAQPLLVEPPAEVPREVRLDQNYPNPFNPSTEISFQLSVAGVVTLKVYDTLGREVATLLNGPEQRGKHEVHWDAPRYASGVYVYRLHVVPVDGSRVADAARTMVLLK